MEPDFQPSLALINIGKKFWKVREEMRTVIQAILYLILKAKKKVIRLPTALAQSTDYPLHS